jgi:hypothetical protein
MRFAKIDRCPSLLRNLTSASGTRAAIHSPWLTRTLRSSRCWACHGESVTPPSEAARSRPRIDRRSTTDRTAAALMTGLAPSEIQRMLIGGP